MNDIKEHSFPFNLDILYEAANISRGISIDAISKAKSGHLGLPLGNAEIGACLFGNCMIYNHKNPYWINRDRFVLSAGHGSMFLYSWLHLSGFKIHLKDIKNFRKLNSITPGHPEYDKSIGIECTTGPLGQGVGNAVGMSISSKMLSAKYNTKKYNIFDNNVICLLGDGCMQEGVTFESLSLAAHLKLDNLILIYDYNNVTLDNLANKTQSEDVEKRFIAMGFNVYIIDGHNCYDFITTYNKIKSLKNNKPSIMICKTIIGKGIIEIEKTQKAHGEFGIKYVEKTRTLLNLPKEKFYISSKVKKYFKYHQKILYNNYKKWNDMFKKWSIEYPSLLKEFENDQKENSLDYTKIIKNLFKLKNIKNIATRESSFKIINELSKISSNIISGSADLYSSCKNYILEGGDFSHKNFNGRNIHFGIREHGMGSIINGINYDGFFKTLCSTFLAFSDYMRASIRLAALSCLPVVYVFTHDSIALGEDGPTHQPIEHISSLRLIPNLYVFRPADYIETMAGYMIALSRKSGPTAIILSRQSIPSLGYKNRKNQLSEALKGAYIVKKEKNNLEFILIATGSEVAIALKVAKVLGDHTRVVSMPCCEKFEEQDINYKNYIIPTNCNKIIIIEAGVTNYWHKYAKSNGLIIGLDKFGSSGSSKTVLKNFGIELNNIINIIRNKFK